MKPLPIRVQRIIEVLTAVKETGYHVAGLRGEKLKVLGFERIGQGAFKSVYAKGKWTFVVKLYSCDGANEVRNFTKAPEHIKPFLLPILAHGPGWMIQKRVASSISHMEGNYWQERGLLCQKHGCPGHIPGMDDSGANNHSHLADGRIVVWDYGQNKQWHKATPDEVANFLAGLATASQKRTSRSKKEAA